MDRHHQSGSGKGLAQRAGVGKMAGERFLRLQRLNRFCRQTESKGLELDHKLFLKRLFRIREQLSAVQLPPRLFIMVNMSSFLFHLYGKPLQNNFIVPTFPVNVSAGCLNKV